MADWSWLSGFNVETVAKSLLPIASAVGAVWTAWKWGAERSDKRGEHLETRQERLQRELDAQQALMNKQGAEALAWLREEAERSRKRLIEVEAERDEAWHNHDAMADIARAWKERCHHLKHELENTRTTVNAAYIQLNLPSKTWVSEQLPQLDRIVEDNAQRFSHKRSVYLREE